MFCENLFKKGIRNALGRSGALWGALGRSWALWGALGRFRALWGSGALFFNFSCYVN